MKTGPDRIRVGLIIEGKVQGVYFRASTVQEAQRLGLTGWVMNRRDGSVEVVAEGLRPKIDELITWCRHGPPGAIVRRTNEHYEPFRDEFERFGVRRQ